MHHDTAPPPDIEIRLTAHEHHAAFARLKRTSEYQLSIAVRADERHYWQHQVDRADSALLRWQAQIDKEMAI